MISVLIPTRGRIKEVLKVVANLYGTATNKQNIEILLRIDDDDEESTMAVRNMPDYVDVFVGPRYRGYLDMHKYVNELCEQAQGDLYLLWNDDVYMKDDGWDVKYGEALEGKNIACLQIATGTQFPAITPKLYDLLGHFSTHCANDSYIEYVCKDTGIMKHINVEVNHLHEEMEDQTRDDFLKISKRQHAEFWGKEIQADIRRDRMKVLKEVKPTLPITAYITGKNGGSFLHNCLSSIWFCDQIIYVDDSSWDGSWSVAKEYATEMYRWYGPNSMAERRNYAIGYEGEEDYVPYWTTHETMKDNHPTVENEWIIYIDDDEELVQGDNLPDMYQMFKTFIDGTNPHLKADRDEAGFLLLMNTTGKQQTEIMSQSPLMRMFKTGTVSFRKDVQNKSIHGDPVGVMPVRLMHYGYGDSAYKFKKLHKRLGFLESDADENCKDISRLNYLINNLASYAQNNNHLERIYALYEAIKRVFKDSPNRKRDDMKTILFLATRSLWKSFFKNKYVDHFLTAIDEVYNEIKEIPDVNHWLTVASSVNGDLDGMIKYGEGFIKGLDAFMNGSFQTNVELEHVGDVASVSRMLSDCYYEKYMDKEVFGKKKKYYKNRSKKFDRKFRELA